MNIPKLQKLDWNKLEKEKPTEKLNNLSVIQLQEMVDRQEKLLANQKLINNLPDKGKKIRENKDKLENALRMRKLTDDTESLLSRLSLGRKIVCNQPLAIRENGIEEEGEQAQEETKVVDSYAKVLCQVFTERQKDIKEKKFYTNKSKECISIFSKNEKLKEKYKDTSLKFYEEKPVTTLSLEDSLKTEKSVTEHQQKVSLKRKAERIASKLAKICSDTETETETESESDSELSDCQ